MSEIPFRVHLTIFQICNKGESMLEKYADVLTIQELEEALKIGRRLAYTLVRDGTIPSKKIGRIYRIPKAAVIEYLKTQV